VSWFPRIPFASWRGRIPAAPAIFVAFLKLCDKLIWVVVAVAVSLFVAYCLSDFWNLVIRKIDPRLPVIGTLVMYLIRFLIRSMVTEGPSDRGKKGPAAYYGDFMVQWCVFWVFVRAFSRILTHYFGF